jgi:UPF0755 protein
MAEFSFVPPNRVAITAPKKRSWRLGRVWLLVIAALVAVMITLGVGFIWWYQSAVYGPDQASGSLVPLKIAQGEQVNQIGLDLQQAGLIGQPQIFEFYVRWSGMSATLQSGQFQIPQHISIHDLVEKLQKANRNEATLRFVEGWRREEMADYIDAQHAAGLITMTGAQFSDLALKPTVTMRAKLGNNLAADVSLQGFLFPDTYVVDRDESAESLIEKMLDTYKKRITTAITAGFTTQGLSVYQGLTLAAIVERESHTGPERSIIAGILLKRIKLGMPLGVDATLQYALGYSASEQRWWRQNLTVDDLALSSPYNTRLTAGLPPHPICNPGLTAMEAVAHSQSTDYLYYIHDTQGQAHYAITLAQHNANIATYLK